jgi:hypothetical protein
MGTTSPTPATKAKLGASTVEDKLPRSGFVLARVSHFSADAGSGAGSGRRKIARPRSLRVTPA